MISGGSVCNNTFCSECVMKNIGKCSDENSYVSYLYDNSHSNVENNSNSPQLNDGIVITDSPSDGENMLNWSFKSEDEFILPEYKNYLLLSPDINLSFDSESDYCNNDNIPDAQGCPNPHDSSFGLYFWYL